MANLNDVLKRTKSLADVISKGVADKAPIKTGKLKRELRKANNINTMLDTKGMNSKEIESESITISIDYAPDGAPYGKFWNEPTLSKTVKKGKTKNIPGSINFVDKALSDAKVNAAVDELVNIIAENFASKISAALDKD